MRKASAKAGAFLGFAQGAGRPLIADESRLSSEELGVRSEEWRCGA